MFQWVWEMQRDMRLGHGVPEHHMQKKYVSVKWGEPLRALGSWQEWYYFHFKNVILMAAYGDGFVGAETGIRGDQFEGSHNSSLRASWIRKMGIPMKFLSSPIFLVQKTVIELTKYLRHKSSIHKTNRGTDFGIWLSKAWISVLPDGSTLSLDLHLLR